MVHSIIQYIVLSYLIKQKYQEREEEADVANIRLVT